MSEHVIYRSYLSHVIVIALLVGCRVCTSHGGLRVGPMHIERLIRESDSILIGKVRNVVDTGIKVSTANASRYYHQMVASIDVCHPLKDCPYENISLLFTTTMRSEIVGGPFPLYLSGNEHLFLMFLKKVEFGNYVKTYRALTYPEPIFSIIELSKAGMGITLYRQAMEIAVARKEENGLSEEDVGAEQEGWKETYSFLIGLVSEHGTLSKKGLASLKEKIRDVQTPRNESGIMRIEVRPGE